MTAALTGWAWRTPLGASVEGVMTRLIAGESGVTRNTRFDDGRPGGSVAAMLPMAPGPSRQQRFLQRMGLFAVEVAVEAMAHAGEAGGERVGLFFGYGGLRAHWSDLMPAFEHQSADGTAAWAHGLSQLHPFWMLKHLSNNAHAIAAQAIGARGEGSTFAGANAGAQAIGGALRALATEAVDAALVVGYDSLVEPETLVALTRRNVLSRDSMPDWTAPYDAAARGCVAGEAAAAIVLRRPGEGHRALAFVDAGDAADGESGEARMATLARLVHDLGRPGDAVDGAGRADPSLDAEERELLARCVGADAPLGCVASAMGQLGAAAAVVQVVALAASLERGVLCPVARLLDVPAGPLRPLRQAEATDRRAAIGVHIGSPGLAGAVRVALP